MNKKSLEVAYETMNSQELAAAAYAHADNELERMRIQAAIPRKTYTMLDAQFTETLDRIFILGHLWTSDYWRLQFLIAAHSAVMINADAKGNNQEGDEQRQAIDKVRQQLAAHFEALKEVCAAHGLDYKTILERNGIIENLDLQSAQVDDEYKETLVETLLALLTVE